MKVNDKQKEMVVVLLFIAVVYVTVVYYDLLMRWVTFIPEMASLVKAYLTMKAKAKLVTYLDVCSIRHYREELLGNMCEMVICPPNTTKTFKIVFKKNRLNKFTSFTIGSKDITDDILMYMGPGYNFYGIPTTPRMLGYTSPISASTRHNELLTFDVDDVIA